MTRARVLLLTAALGPLDYRVPQGSEAPIGSIVVAPLGPRRLGGVVWDDDSFGAPPPVGDNRLRNLYEILDVAPIAAPLRRLVEWTSHYYLAHPGSVLRMVLPGVAFQDAKKPITEYRASGQFPQRMTAQRTAALEAIDDRQGNIKELAALADVSEAVIRGLVQHGALEAAQVSANIAYPVPDPEFAPPILSDLQMAAAEQLRGAVQARKFATLLLDGVTGSGKTEVYMEAVAAAIEDGRQALVLLPEIALTEPMLTRFTARFGCEPVAWHSGLRQSERRRAWHAIASGEAKIIMGARSALYLPYRNLGTIIVDEAHETSFKQEDGVHYHARDVAVMRGHFEGIAVVLASATPALESLAQVEAGRYQHIQLPSRFGGATMPALTAIDMRKDPPDRGTWIAPPLVDALADRLKKGEQSLLFLNRRGFAPLTLCRTCGHRIQCPNCTAWMVEHRLVHRLSCHHCGHTMPPPRLCPECDNEDTLVACGPGVERVADEVKLRFPQARTAIVTSDTLWSPAKAAEFVEEVEAGMVDIIVGTQLVTKGYHFPNLTLVGVVDADLGLDGGDLRAAERTFQQIAQVAGRAGRGVKAGTVMVQTRMPEAPVMAALVAGDRDGFYAAEADARKFAGAPPYGRFAALIISSEDQDLGRITAKKLSDKAPSAEGLAVYGPAPAPLAMLRGRHRFRLLLHAPRSFDLQGAIRDWLSRVDIPNKVRLAVDIDPYSFV
ncbi:primosomal protein N' [Sphingopyxis yananensis]|uniref:primosomal protein N' n=1 Tax=Sphingopyxis yananensis TaxID=2886687 RepID=UPI001D115F8F|nr:primosomal protein N' [Sphingopyxis yananensis]MCC2602939.1 primosomal protein N' [Sphingopyxis yananensis]